ncbi:MAG: PTS sugar transporter subunit IIA [Proteobacteria bacterium]|jgi:mannitol/fructose-specific phosphotransferase system IIA component (Ntr-type)|nr:PTS sugar transporter subunit IIA [Pseudomonadota bacterium]
MKQIMNQLIQLQDLSFTLDEQKALTTETHLKNLEESIQTLTAGLPPDIAKLFHKLIKRNATAVVPMAKGICTGCGMAVPTILAYEVQVGEKIFQCPRCTRIIYYRESLPRQIKRVSIAQSVKPSAGLDRFSASRLMIPELQGGDRNDVLAEMTQLLAEQGYIEQPERLLEAALSRESMVPTAIEHGLAFPHVRGVEGGGLIFACGVKKDGIAFGAPKKHLTRIFFFIVIPLAASAFYLQLITGLMESFREAPAREKLLECKTPEKMWQVLNQLTKKSIA